MQWPSTEPKKKSTRTKKLSVSLTNMGPRTAGSAVDGDRAVLTVEEVVFVCLFVVVFFFFFFFFFFGGGGYFHYMKMSKDSKVKKAKRWLRFISSLMRNCSFVVVVSLLH